MPERYAIRSAVALHRRYPSTFQIPPADVRRGLLPGDLAKLVFADRHDDRRSERMWVLVEAVDIDRRYHGRLASHPVVVDCLRHGDAVEFGPDDVADCEHPADCA